jgi:hypothetical protein
MEPPLPTDEDTNLFFDKVIALLERDGSYSHDEACALTREYYEKFRDERYCQSINIPVQDDDFFFHEGYGGMARRIHYYLGLKGDPDPRKFIEWRTNL